MDWIYSHPLRPLLAEFLLAGSVVLAWRGTRYFVRGLRSVDHPSQPRWVVLGFRGWIGAAALVFIGAGLLARTTWPILFGLVFLGEELFETGIMLLALKKQERDEATRP